MLQDILAEPEWTDILGDADRRGLTPLFTSNMTPVRGHPTRHQPPPRPRRHASRALDKTVDTRRRITPRLSVSKPGFYD
jgi:hypothetical protein